MRKLVSILIAFMMLFALAVSPSSASIGTKVDNIRRAVSDINFSGTAGDAISVDGNGLTFNLLLAGVGNGDATSMTSSDLAVPIGFSQVWKIIANDSAFTAGTLADGKPGQILVIEISEQLGSETFTVTPATSTRIATLGFNAAGDRAVLLFTGSTNGWISWSLDSVTLTRP